MFYPAYENILSTARLNRYLVACDGQTKKAMTLYRLNQRLSQMMFTTIGNFEVALRNSIDKKLNILFGDDWLLEGVAQGGLFDNEGCRVMTTCINEALRKIEHRYSHNKLIAELGFGFWRYFFAMHQFNITGQCLLNIVSGRPHSSIVQHFNRRFIFNQLAQGESFAKPHRTSRTHLLPARQCN